MRKTRTLGNYKLINENDSFNCLPKITLDDTDIELAMVKDRNRCGNLTGANTTSIHDRKAGHAFAFTQSRRGSRTLYVKQVG